MTQAAESALDFNTGIAEAYKLPTLSMSPPQPKTDDERAALKEVLTTSPRRLLHCFLGEEFTKCSAERGAS
jgi:hypothetical protein